MDQEQKNPLLFEGSNAAYWGLSMFAAIGGGLAYTFDSIVLSVIGGIFGLMAVYGVLFGRFSNIRLNSGKAIVRRGLLAGKKAFDLNKIESIHLGKERESRGDNLLEIDLEKTGEWSNYSYLQLWMKGAKKPILNISKSDFDEEEFQRLAQGIKQYFIEEAGSPLQRAKATLIKTKKYLHADKELRKELIETLNKTYLSVYKPFKTLLSKDIIETLKAERNVVYQAIQQGNVLLYFKEGEYREGIVESSADLRLAKQLIETTERNLDMVQARVDSHENVKQRLEKTINALEKKQSLSDVTKKLNQLQQHNAGIDIHRQDVALEAEIIEQLQALTDEIQNNEDLNKSLELREQARLINEKKK